MDQLSTPNPCPVNRTLLTVKVRANPGGRKYDPPISLEKIGYEQ